MSGSGPARPEDWPDPDRQETLHLPAGGQDPDPYSATVLDGGPWSPSDERTITGPGPQAPAAPGPTLREGAVLRFGPGVPAPAAPGWPVPAPARPRRRGLLLRRYGLALVVLVAVALFVLWQRGGPGVTVTGVRVLTPPAPACGGTADVTGLVSTDGNPGTIRYRWVRSDGTTSQTLEERVTRGQREAELHLLWRFEGEGTIRATAELHLLTPTPASATTTFTYTCP
ncbi:hypothetical protein RM780_22455 [Streptomyces sp. DSM 44917]|uniref:Ig-like domain-containing protein n=1 Tax=Streptomyces boetiae TaxID=3075541 RepID=A0ABU2LEU3_9ACTN|nr:hypothetical protein [Streptomyces sp. DSM 44917]MDT0309698.1 hypothetical protein [Streptomyces sp. DSM 44917]